MFLVMIKQSVWVLVAAVAVALASGCITDTSEPNLDPGLEISFTTVDVGGVHACGIDADGTAYCWGGNGVGQLGVGDENGRFQPTRVNQGDEGYREVYGGAVHTCALSTASTLFCWGNNDWGQLGTGQLGGLYAKPVEVVFAGGWLSAAAGDLHTCGVTGDRRAFCWGLAEDGQLGNGLSGTGQFRATPQAVLGDLLFEKITTGGAHTCALTLDDRVYCWGAGGDGQLGIGASGNRDRPDSVATDLLFDQIDAGLRHTCGVTLEGDAYCWGLNESGQLGTGDNSPRDTPALVVGGLTWATISAGGSHTCAVTTTGEAYCWGLNGSGELGDGTTINRDAPAPVAGGLRFELVKAGGAVFTTGSCGRSTSGIVYCWGFGGDGLLGNGGVQNSSVPVEVASQGPGRGAFPTP